MDAIKTFIHAGYRVTIQQDTDAQSPEDWGNDDLFLVASHRQFDVRRKGFDCDADTPKEHKADYHVLPLIAYIHSGVALSLGSDSYPFNDAWDAGQVGWVLVQKRAGFRNIRKAAQSLVAEWNQYLSGDVYGYIVSAVESGDDDTDIDEMYESELAELEELEHVDSCWGFYGLEYCEAEAKRAAEYARGQENTETAKINSVMAL